MLIRLENGDVGDSDVKVRSLYLPPICVRRITVLLLPSKQSDAGSTPVARSSWVVAPRNVTKATNTYPWCNGSTKDSKPFSIGSNPVGYA